MKTTKLFLSIALVALATSSFGQLSSLKSRLFPGQKAQVVYFTADYQTEGSRIEEWMFDVSDWASNIIRRDDYEAPVICMTITANQVEVLYEQELDLEAWMTGPFKGCKIEEEICLELWMSHPFTYGFTEDELVLESWMTTPFNGLISEEDLTIESWMTTPFEASEPMEIEDWMVAAWI